MKYIKTISFNGNPIQVKIGIHRGHAIAGILGFHKP